MSLDELKERLISKGGINNYTLVRGFDHTTTGGEGVEVVNLFYVDTTDNNRILDRTLFLVNEDFAKYSKAKRRHVATSYNMDWLAFHLSELKQTKV
mgnify:CR=1 FL=1